jgi:hypothetical protein
MMGIPPTIDSQFSKAINSYTQVEGLHHVKNSEDLLIRRKFKLWNVLSMLKRVFQSLYKLIRRAHQDLRA